VAILSSEFIPKERLSAYQRWELATLEEPVEARPPEDTAAIALDALREEAKAAGHAEAAPVLCTGGGRALDSRR
jgi:flagellar assembly protein FliH